jgi:LysR family carnitine catabolism transcriptional activator
MSPTLRQFAAFVEVARHGSFARAAERLGLSQPALSQSITQMEQLLGAKLFRRTTRAVRLTAEGALLLPRAEQVLSGVEEAVALVREQAQLSRARVSLGSLPSVAAAFLPEILRLFRLRQPATRVAVTDGTSEVLYAGIAAGQIDIAIGSRLRGHASVSFQPVLRERFALVLPRAHPLARKPAVTWAEALRHDFVAFPPGSGGRAAIEDALQQASLALNPVMTFAQASTALNMVAAGAGVTALPALGCPPASHRQLAVRPLIDPVVEREVGIVRSATGEPSAATLALQDISIRCMTQSRLPGLVPQNPAAAATGSQP